MKAMTKTTIVRNLEDIQLRKDELQASLTQSREKVSGLWHDLTTVKPTNDKGEMVSGIISKGIMAFDMALVITKLYRRYGTLFKRKKKRLL